MKTLPASLQKQNHFSARFSLLATITEKEKIYADAVDPALSLVENVAHYLRVQI